MEEREERKIRELFLRPHLTDKKVDPEILSDEEFSLEEGKQLGFTDNMTDRTFGLS